MKLLNSEMWAIWVAFALMVAAAIIFAWKNRIPNYLSLLGTLLAWLVAIGISCSVGIPSGGGGILASLTGTLLAFALLLPLFLMRVLGAGSVKMQMAFGAWMGCAIGPAATAWLTIAGTLVGGLLTAVIGAIVARRMMRRLKTGKLNELIQALGQGDSHASLGAAQMLFPAQLTLSLGSIAGVVVILLLKWV